MDSKKRPAKKYDSYRFACFSFSLSRSLSLSLSLFLSGMTLTRSWWLWARLPVLTPVPVQVNHSSSSRRQFQRGQTPEEPACMFRLLAPCFETLEKVALMWCFVVRVSSWVKIVRQPDIFESFVRVSRDSREPGTYVRLLSPCCATAMVKESQKSPFLSVTDREPGTGGQDVETQACAGHAGQPTRETPEGR